MRGKRFFDTNVLVYALNMGQPKSEMALDLLRGGGIVSVQALNEFTSVARRKLGMTWAEVVEALGYFRSFCPKPEPLTIATHERAIAVAKRWGYHFYDSLMIASALNAGCETLYSEDMQDGQQLEGLTIRNPFR